MIPLNNHLYDKEEKTAVLKALKSKDLTGDGLYSKQLSLDLKQLLGVKYALPTPSGTAALELAIMTLDLKPADEVILPSFTFTSCANAILRERATPVFVDIEMDTFNIDPDQIEAHITHKTRAIMVVHYAGHSVDFKAILKIAKKYKLYIIEDAAHALGAYYKSRHLGTIGHIGCYSFHGVKNITSGEGGAFVTNDPNIGKKAEIIRDKGTNRAAFLRGEVDRYTWHGLGSSFVLADILSAVISAQIKKILLINQRREENAKYLLENLSAIPDITLPIVKGYATTNWHIFAIKVNPSIRDRLIQYLRANQIEASFHFIPLHSSPFGRKEMNYKTKSLPITELVAKSLIRLPVHPMLTKKDLRQIVKAVRAGLKHINH